MRVVTGNGGGLDPQSRSRDVTPTDLYAMPSIARVYNYLLGGKDHFEVDRKAAERLLAVVPYARDLALANYRWAARVVTYCAGQGIDQIVDIGVGIPLLRKDRPSTFDAARAANPAATVIGIDNDPVVLAHGRALTADHGNNIVIIEGDVRFPEKILDHLRGRLDPTRPVAVIMAAVLHCVTDAEDPYRIVATIADTCAPGSYIACSHVSNDGIDPDLVHDVEQVYANATSPVVMRSRREIEGLFNGLELEEPGLVDVQQWRPQIKERPTPVRGLCAVGRVPPRDPEN